MFASGNIEILGKQNLLFPYGLFFKLFVIQLEIHLTSL